MNALNSCPARAMDLSPPFGPPRLWPVLRAYMQARRAWARQRQDLLALTELSEHTLKDISAPCWMRGHASGRHEAERGRLEVLRAIGHQLW